MKEGVRYILHHKVAVKAHTMIAVSEHTYQVNIIISGHMGALVTLD
jgi:hypothetical protein